MRSARPAAPPSSGSTSLSASAADHRGRGRSGGVRSAPAGGSRSRVPGRRSSTTSARAASSASGRSTGDGGSRKRRRPSSPTSCRGPGGTVALTYVPGDPERAWKRGDVGPRGLARALGEIWELPVHDVLRRTGAQPRQRGLTLADRRRNVRGTVVATGASPRAVCLVDDVYTSGATADACASALRKAGAMRVEVVTLARAVR